jgi:hypothetical protein
VLVVDSFSADDTATVCARERFPRLARLILTKACQMPGQSGRFARKNPSISEIHAVG